MKHSGKGGSSMKRVFQWIVIPAFLGLLIGAVYYLNHALPIGTGYSAKYVCSQVFLAGREPEPVFNIDVRPANPLFRLVSTQVNYENKTVTAKGLGFFSARTAVYREGCGCTLAVETDRDALLEQARDLRSATPQRPASLAWPLGETVDLDRLPPGVDRQGLARAMDEFFAEPGPGRLRDTRAVIIVQGNRIIAERYAPGFSRETPMLGWSMSKSVTAALVGILVRDGVLDISQPAPVAAWQSPDDPRRAITTDMLLRMSSGLDFTEKYKPFKDATTMLYNRGNMAAYAASKALAGPPDSRWSYSSGTTNILAHLVFEAVGGSLKQAHDFARTRLFEKIGALSAVIEPDASGRFVGSSYMFATARDWARFGLLLKNHGVWYGERILPKGWVQYAITPTPQAPQGKYGAQIWLNAGEKENPAQRIFPSLPRDVFYCGGFNGQIVAVVPAMDLVLVRLGVTHQRKNFSREWFISRVMEVMKPQE